MKEGRICFYLFASILILVLIPFWIGTREAQAAGGVSSVTFGPSEPLSTWTETGSMAFARRDHVATKLQDGSVLIVGWDSTAELYNPSTGEFTTIGNTIYGHFQGASATLLQDGKVIIVGGTNALG